MDLNKFVIFINLKHVNLLNKFYDFLLQFRLNASHMLELLRGKRLVFVGDSLNRNMWESLVCILRNSVKDKRNVFEASGRHYFRTEASYSFIFKVGSSTVLLGIDSF